MSFFAKNYPKRFKVVDAGKLEDSSNNHETGLDETESLCDDSLTDTSNALKCSFNRGQAKTLKSVCSELQKGSHALLACDTNRLKVYNELGLYPMIFAFDPVDNQKSIKDIYYLLNQGRTLPSKKAKRLLVRSKSVHNELRKMKVFWGKLTGSLNEIEGLVVKHTEQMSNFNLFVEEQPNPLRTVLKEQVHEFLNSQD